MCHCTFVISLALKPLVYASLERLEACRVMYVCVLHQPVPYATVSREERAEVTLGPREGHSHGEVVVMLAGGASVVCGDGWGRQA